MWKIISLAYLYFRGTFLLTETGMQKLFWLAVTQLTVKQKYHLTNFKNKISRL